jgi:hypothetical protein
LIQSKSTEIPGALIEISEVIPWKNFRIVYQGTNLDKHPWLYFATEEKASIELWRYSNFEILSQFKTQISQLLNRGPCV